MTGKSPANVCDVKLNAGSDEVGPIKSVKLRGWEGREGDERFAEGSV